MTDDSTPPTFPRRRSRIWRFRRYETPQPPDLLAGVGDAGIDALNGPPPDDGEYYPVAEDFIPTPPKPKGPLSRVPESSAVRPALFCFILFFVASGQYWQAGRDGGGWASGEAVFEHGQWWRLLTALFTHSDLGHLLSNTPLFLIFGWYLYAFFGGLAFPLGALLIGVLSNAATIYFYSPTTHLVGASGMLYGMVALWLVLYVRFETDYTVTMRVFRAIGVSLVLLFPTTFQEQTSYLAHAAGFAIGMIVGFLLMPFVSVRTPSPRPMDPRPSESNLSI